MRAASEKRQGKDIPVVRPVRISKEDLAAIQSYGPVVMVRDLVDPERPTWHDPRKLADAFAG